MNCQVSHKIKLSNLRNSDEVISHQFLLFKGTVGKRCIIEDFIYLKSNCSSIQKCQVSRGGEFKLLCNLQAGAAVVGSDQKHIFTLVYCREVLEISITYRPKGNDCDFYHIQPLYIICRGHDGVFYTRNKDVGTPKEACKLIDLNLKIVQSVYAEKLRESGFGRRTFSLHAPCQLFHSQLTVDEAYSYDEDTLWNRFASEILNSEVGRNDNLKFVAFIGCTNYEGSKVAGSGDYSYANIRRNLQAHAALGGGGLALFGSGYFYAWPREFSEIVDFFKNNEEIDILKFPDDSNYRRTFAGVYATTLGSVCHEIGHIFDLGHTQDGIMGNGFDYLNRVFTVDNLTENLPNRVIDQSATSVLVTRPRLTQFKTKDNTFLSKYHEQKQSDSFYFTRNCAVILAFHKWFHGGRTTSASPNSITFDPLTKHIRSPDEPIKLVEIRQTSNSLVQEYFEFANAESLHFEVPSSYHSSTEHYLFVITKYGTTKRLSLIDMPEETETQKSQ